MCLKNRFFSVRDRDEHTLKLAQFDVVCASSGLWLHNEYCVLSTWNTNLQYLLAARSCLPLPAVATAYRCCYYLLHFHMYTCIHIALIRGYKCTLFWWWACLRLCRSGVIAAILFFFLDRIHQFSTRSLSVCFVSICHYHTFDHIFTFFSLFFAHLFLRK